MNARAHQNRIPKFLLRLALGLGCAWAFLVGAPAALGQTNIDTEKQTKIAALKKERDDAIKQVQKIVNQPVPRYARPSGVRIAEYSEGWFHPGAPIPDYDKVDVRQTQTFAYDSHPFVTSPMNPGVVFRGTDLEFNEMTKYFITDRSVPKKRLTEAEMLEINRLYRVIGQCRKDLFHLENPPPKLEDIRAAESDSGTNSEAATELVRQPVPRKNYIKAAIGVSAVLLIYVLFLLVRRLIRS
jgi:hypothetical protein